MIPDEDGMTLDELLWSLGIDPDSVPPATEEEVAEFMRKLNELDKKDTQ